MVIDGGRKDFFATYDRLQGSLTDSRQVARKDFFAAVGRVNADLLPVRTSGATQTTDVRVPAADVLASDARTMDFRFPDDVRVGGSFGGMSFSQGVSWDRLPGAEPARTEEQRSAQAYADAMDMSRNSTPQAVRDAIMNDPDRRAALEEFQGSKEYAAFAQQEAELLQREQAAAAQSQLNLITNLGKPMNQARYDSEALNNTSMTAIQLDQIRNDPDRMKAVNAYNQAKLGATFSKNPSYAAALSSERLQAVNDYNTLNAPASPAASTPPQVVDAAPASAEPLPEQEPLQS